MNLQIRDLSELPHAASEILRFSSEEKIFLFKGEMGAGKTTLIKAICHSLGVADSISSPTYSIVNEYQYPAGKIFHFDFFRIKSESEAYDLGFEEYLYSGEYCFIEWPGKITGLWPGNYLEIIIEQFDGDLRTIYLRKV